MDRFESIQVQGFRRLYDVFLPLKPLNVLIGANGSGKTSLLEAFSLLAASASGNLQKTLSDYGGVEANTTVYSETDDGRARLLHFELHRSVAGRQPLKYSIAVQPKNVAYEIMEESLTQQQDPDRPQPFKHFETSRGRVRYFDATTDRLELPEWEVYPLESALSQVPKMYREPEEFRKSLASSTHYHVLDVGPQAAVRLPQPMRDAKLPGRNGEDLVSCLYWMREADRDRFELIEDTLRAGFPTFERLNFPPVAAGTLAMTWKEKALKHPFYMHQLSEGTLRFLWLVTLLCSPGLTDVTMIDEPEVSLHPELLSILADCLREASQRTQLIVATHADRLVRFLHPDEVVVMDVCEDGTATATRADELDLGAWLDEYTLDEVWRNGRMGGRP
jgi:predicted ATPase